MQVISYNNRYASGFRRLIAFFIDHLAIGTVLSILTWQMFDWPFRLGGWSDMYHWDTWDTSFGLLSQNFFKEALIILYYAFMESSKYQATLGKMVLGLRVVGHTGQKIDFSKALLRNLSKILSALILGIGYIMIIFDSRKQGLHDKIADTFVVRQ